MTRVTMLVLAITMLWTTVPAMAVDDSKRTCTLTRAYECANDAGCKEWSMEEMSLPRFVQIDIKEKSIKSLDRNMPRDATKVEAVERLEEMLVMHGTEQRGWTMVVGNDSGALTLTAAGDGEGFVVFGFCMNP